MLMALIAPCVGAMTRTLRSVLAALIVPAPAVIGAAALAMRDHRAALRAEQDQVRGFLRHGGGLAASGRGAEAERSPCPES